MMYAACPRCNTSAIFVLPAFFGPRNALISTCDVSSAVRRRPRDGPCGENSNMRFFHQFRAGLIGLIAIVGANVPSATYADSGIVRFSVLKAGWFIGGSGGRGVLIFHGRQYPLSI